MPNNQSLAKRAFCLQMCGVAMATAGFIIAKSQFGVPYQQVFMSHGMLGISVLTLIYSQVRGHCALTVCTSRVWVHGGRNLAGCVLQPAFEVTVYQLLSGC